MAVTIEGVTERPVSYREDGEPDRPERQGVLTRVTVAVYGLLAITACFVVACAPYVAAVLLLPNPVVLALTGSTIGPAWVATLATASRYATSRDLEPVRVFVRQWRTSAVQAAVFWTPFFVLVLLLAAGLTSASGPDLVARIAIAVLGVALLLWGSTVLVLISRFSFRLRDVLRLAVWGLAASPRWLIADLALLVVVGGLILWGGEPLAGLLVAPVALGTVVNAAPLVERVRRGFTVEGRTEEDA